MIDYDTYSYLYPPRPEKAIPKDLLGFYESRGWVAQVKKNGTCTVVFAKGKQVIFKTRHQDDHKAWTPLEDHVKFFQGFKKWTVFAGELIHSKTPLVKNQLYLFDVLVDDGKLLDGVSFEERQLLLNKWEGQDEFDKTRITPYISITKNFSKDFLGVYNTLQLPVDEGLVLKDPSSKLKSCFNASGNSNWQVKCRQVNPNYSF